MHAARISKPSVRRHSRSRRRSDHHSQKPHQHRRQFAASASTSGNGSSFEKQRKYVAVGTGTGRRNTARGGSAQLKSSNNGSSAPSAAGTRPYGLPFQDFPPGYFTLDTPLPSGKHKGIAFRDLPPSYLTWLQTIGLAHVRADVLECLAQLGFSHNLRPFVYTDNMLNQTDSNIIYRYEQLAQPDNVPEYWGTGQLEKFRNAHRLAAKWRHIRTLTSKVYAVRSAIWDAQTIAQVEGINQAYPTLEAVMAASKIGTQTFPVMHINGWQDTLRDTDDNGVESSDTTTTSATTEDVPNTYKPHAPGDASRHPEYENLRNTIIQRLSQELNDYAATYVFHDEHDLQFVAQKTAPGDISPAFQTCMTQEFAQYQSSSMSSHARSILKTPHPVLTPPRFIAAPARRVTELSDSAQRALEPYREVPQTLPENYVFFNALSLSTSPDLNNVHLSHLAHLAAVDGAGNEFNARICPPIPFERLDHTSDYYVSNNFEKYWSPSHVAVDVALDGFMQWFYHPLTTRRPTHMLTNPLYKDPLQNMQLLARLRHDVDNRTVTQDELEALPPLVRKVFSDPTKRKSKLSYNYLSQILTVNGVRAQLSLPSSTTKDQQFIQTHDGYLLLKNGISSQIQDADIVQDTEDIFQLFDSTILSDSTNNTTTTATIQQQQQQQNDSTTSQLLSSSSSSLQSIIDTFSTLSLKQKQEQFDYVTKNYPSQKPNIMIGMSMTRQLRRIDATLRELDYALHGNNLNGLDPLLLERLTDNSERLTLLQQYHRDNASDALRHVFFNNGQMDPILFRPGPIHAIFADISRPFQSIYSLLNVHALRDLFFADNLAGTFFRAELARIEDNFYNNHHLSLKYPDMTSSQNNDHDMSSPQRFDMWTNSYILDDNTINRRTTTTNTSSSSSSSSSQSYIFNSPYTKWVNLAQTERQQLACSVVTSPHTTPKLSSSLLGGNNSSSSSDQPAHQLSPAALLAKNFSSGGASPGSNDDISFRNYGLDWKTAGIRAKVAGNAAKSGLHQLDSKDIPNKLHSWTPQVAALSAQAPGKVKSAAQQDTSSFPLPDF